MEVVGQQAKLLENYLLSRQAFGSLVLLELLDQVFVDLVAQ